MLDFVHGLDNVLVAFGYHLVLQCPTCAARKLGNDDVAVAEEVDVEIDVVNRL
jgi:hypothetical protein